MKEVECTWSQAFVGVCTRCHDRVCDPTITQEGNAGENLKNYIKASLRTKGHAGAIRAVTTSCLGLCPLGSHAVVVHAHNAKGKMLALHPEEDRVELVNYLSQLADS
ncbi:MAG: hypothetical protein CME71_06935 [Halobacteriovorax sp.]|nr:hypothetical protein [Halobacteriovorax sp.]